MKKLIFTVFATAFLFAQDPGENWISLFGQVSSVAEDGIERPIAGAFIAIPDSWQDSTFAISDEEGYYELSFVWNWYGPVTVICEAEGYQSESVTFFPEETEVELDFSLYPEQDDMWGLLTGNVFAITSDGAPGEPIAGATILAHGNDPNEVYETYSGNNGHYTLQLPVGPYFVTCSAEGFQEQTVELYVGDFIETHHDFYLVPHGEPGDDYRVFGHVFGVSGSGMSTPIAGAYLTAEPTSPIEPIWETETNNAGMYEFFLPDGEYVFHAYAEGYETGEAVFYVGANHENYHDFYLEYENPNDDAMIFGHVFAVDIAGIHQPIPGVLIQAMNDELNTVFEAVTGENGGYEMDVEANLNYTVMCFVDASTEPLVQYVYVENAPVEVNFIVESPTAFLYGQVLGGTSNDTDDWHPLVGALIDAMPVDSPVEDIFYYAETDENGIYEMVLPVGSYYVTASYEGYPSVTREVYVTSWTENVLDFVLLTDPNPENAGIHGVVLFETPNGEMPIPGAHIIAYYDDTNTGFEAFTGENGGYEMEVEANQHYYLTCTVELSGMVLTQETEIYVGDEWVEKNFIFGEEPPMEAMIVGHVWRATEDGNHQPIPGALIEATCENSSEIYTAESGEHGGYEMAVYPNAHYVVTCTVSDPNGETHTQTQNVYVGEWPVEVNFVFGQTEPEYGALIGFVGGITADGDVAPIVGAQVWGMGPMQWTFEVFTNENGMFFVEELPASTYYMQVNAEGYQQGNATVEIVAGETTEMEMVLQPGTMTPQIVGHVVYMSETGEHYPLDAFLRAQSPNGQIYEAVTNDAGHYEMDVQGNMYYSVSCFAFVQGDSLFAEQSVFVGNGVAELNFEFGGQPQNWGILVGYVFDATLDFGPIEGAIVHTANSWEFYEAVTNADGYFEMEIPAGAGYYVYIQAEGYETWNAEEPLTIFPNEITEIEAHLMPTQTEDTGWLFGTVRENCDFEPWQCPSIIGATVEIYNVQGEFVTFTDSLGNYAIELPAAGGYSSYVVHISAEGYNDFYQEMVEIYPNEETVVDAWLDPIEEPNYEVFLDIGDATGMPGSEVTVPVYMTNDCEIAGWQFSLGDIPNAATVVDATTPFVDFMLSFNDLGEYANFIAFSLTGDIISVGEHLLMEITFQISDDISVAEHIELQPAEWIFSDGGANPIPAEAEGGVITFGMKGDVNMDGAINVLDIVQMVNIIVENTDPTEYEFWAADYNDDNTVNVLDIVSIVNFILEDGGLTKTSATEATLRISPSGMMLITNGAVAGLQFSADRPDAIFAKTTSDEIFATGAEKGVLVSTTGELSTLTFDFAQPVEIGEIMVVNSAGEIVETTIEWIPDEFALLQNYPNPFNPTTTIEYQIAEDCEVKINVYNLLGELVSALVNYEQRSGYYSVSWDGTMADGSVAATGFYFARLQAGEFQSTVKMVLTK